MFDFHMHSLVSFDGHCTAEEMAQAAAAAGLKEICFTDHIDYFMDGYGVDTTFTTEAYRAAYDHLAVPGLTIRKGLEFGLAPDNVDKLAKDLERYPFDFVLGSVHLLDGEDVYLEPYWQGKTVDAVYHHYLERTLDCVKAHDSFDVLAHLTYVCKCPGNPERKPIRYADDPELLDEILTTLAKKGKGLEINTSGVDRCGDYLPGMDIVRRFKELGGQIVTVGSDAHRINRVGQYTFDVCELLKDIFGYVCTFENRKPVFHKL